MGVAFDGDGDRAIFADHRGHIVDGDAVLLLLGVVLQRAGAAAHDTLVATVMSNIGLEIALQRHGIRLVRTPVGDKYVMDEMLRGGYALGGEQSGHVILTEHLPTGDGMATALAVLRVMAETGKELSELAAGPRDVSADARQRARPRETSDRGRSGHSGRGSRASRRRSRGAGASSCGIRAPSRCCGS